MEKIKYLLIGAGGHARVILSIIEKSRQKVLGIFDKEGSKKNLDNIPVIGDYDKNVFSEAKVIIAIGDNFARKKIASNIYHKFGVIIEKSACIDNLTKIGLGSVIFHKSLIQRGSIIGKHCIINSNSSIDHDCIVSDFASLAPGVIIGGDAKVGELSAISIGAVCKHGIKIGNDSVIGASSYVNKDVGNNVVAYGIPCKKIRDRMHGEPYLA